jgi:DNA-binding transcriptional ArsR family regulator
MPLSRVAMSFKEPKTVDGKRARGRPRVHREPWTKVSVVLFERQILALDRFRTTVRRKTGAALTRAEVIRALLDGLHRSRVDASTITSATDLERLVVSRLAIQLEDLGI